jgi:hypothetical protein
MIAAITRRERGGILTPTDAATTRPAGRLDLATAYQPAFPILKYHTSGSTCVNLLLSMEMSGRAMVAWEAPHG